MDQRSRHESHRIGFVGVLDHDGAHIGVHHETRERAQHLVVREQLEPLADDRRRAGDGRQAGDGLFLVRLVREVLDALATLGVIAPLRASVLEELLRPDEAPTRRFRPLSLGSASGSAPVAAPGDLTVAADGDVPLRRERRAELPGEHVAEVAEVVLEQLGARERSADRVEVGLVGEPDAGADLGVAYDELTAPAA